MVLRRRWKSLEIAGDPECTRLQQNPSRWWHLEGWFVLFLSPLSGAWPSPSSLPAASAVGCILPPLRGWFLRLSSSAGPLCFLYGKLGACIGLRSVTSNWQFFLTALTLWMVARSSA